VTHAPGSGNHQGIRQGWATGVGGTTQLWGGQLWPWEPWEFEGDASLGIPSWPADTAARVQNSYGAVLNHLGLRGAHGEIHRGALAARQGNAGLRGGRVRYSSWMNRRERQFALNPSLAQARSRITFIEMRVDRVEERQRGWVALGTVDGTGSHQIEATRLVLAAGTLGNVSILSASSAAVDLPRLGSGFMDHVSAPVVEFRMTNPSAFRSHGCPTFFRGVLGSPRLIPPRFNEQVLPGYGHWEIAAPDWVPVDEIKVMLRSRRPHGLVEALGLVRGHETELVGAATAALVGRSRPATKSSRVYLRVDVQQPPRPESQLSLDTESGEMALRWLIGAAERTAIRDIGASLVRDLDVGRLGLELVRILDDPEPQDIFHMMGGTPMGDLGVVDEWAQLRVGTGTYIAGPSVFPCGGMANPTLTALSLSEASIAHIAEA
jgi:choline dehydrogenase-like flavoprotein